MKQEFKDELIAAAKEFSDKKGMVEIEFSIHRDSLNEVFDFIRDEVTTPLGVWFAYECPACQVHWGEEFLHLGLEEYPKVVEYFKKNNVMMYDPNSTAN